jgi:hypothetical protein
MIGFGIALLTTIVVGEAFVSEALSPGAHPGNPPPGVQRPEVSVQFPLAGGALEVTEYAVGTHTARATPAIPRRAATVIPNAMTNGRNLTRSIFDIGTLLGRRTAYRMLFI